MKVNPHPHPSPKFTTERGKKRKSSPPRWGDIATNLPGGSALMRRVREQKLMDAWEEAVGEGVAQRTEPIRIKNRVLYLKVTNSVWMQQLQFMKELIIKKMHEKTGIDFLQDIRFFIGEVGHLDKKEENEETLPVDFPSLSQSEKEQIIKEVSGVQDPEMQEILSRLYSRALAAERNRGKKENCR